MNIENGSQILLKSSRRIFVQGELYAMGIENQTINFLPIDGPDLEIKFITGSTGGSFDYCVFQGDGLTDLNIASTDSVVLRNCTFLPSNSTNESLEMNIIQGRLSINNCILNSVSRIGVEDYLWMRNSILFNSRSGIVGGQSSVETIILQNNIFSRNGESIKLPDSDAEANIDHNVFVNNPGIYTTQLGIAIDYWTVTFELYEWDVTNNIIIDNTIGIFNNGSQTNSQSQQDYNDVWSNLINYGGNLTNPGSNSISTDPLFVSPDYMNPMNGNWNLQGGSPCIGSGMNGTNIGLIDPNNVGPQ